MRIATKLNAIVVVVFAVSVFGIHLALQETIRPQFLQIENETSLANHKRILDALDEQGKKLRGSSQDWAQWTDMYQFAHGEDTETFIAENLSVPTDTLDGLKIDGLLIRDLSGRTLWAAAVNYETKEELPDLRDELSAIEYSHPYLSGGPSLDAVAGLFKTSRGLVLAGTAPILPTDRTGAPAGTVWMVSMLNTDHVQELTGVKFRLDQIEGSQAAEPHDIQSEFTNDIIETSSTLLSLTGQPLAILRVDTPRDVSKAGDASIRSAMWLLIGAAAAVILVLWLFVRTIVVSPITKLNQHFSAVSTDGRLHKTDHDKSSDEIGDLARSFNNMAEQVNHLRDALADSAYLSGMSEWAAGTLHNVRNSLSPINALAWKTENLFANEWIGKIRSAAKQLRAPETAEERREKLSSYLVTSCEQLAESAEKMKETLQDISSASRGIEEMISGYEKYSRFETVREEIDLLPLIQDVARKTISDKRLPILVNLPSHSAVFVGNRTIVRQVLLNLFWNAIDAMAEQMDEKGRIDVGLQVEPSGVLQVKITDYGEGIAPEQLKSIFERGFSTRKNKQGGLGLHWCANAVKALGGTLSAESQGSGKGATLILSLPSSDTHLKEAA
jgi:signal transduction histidine kinase